MRCGTGSADDVLMHVNSASLDVLLLVALGPNQREFWTRDNFRDPRGSHGSHLKGVGCGFRNSARVLRGATFGHWAR